ncbi:MAG: transcriptional activator NhaR [Chromatiales bacterium]|jgi:LysR family transcriptional activator of nhaA|nr:MAG: transcriptional activator NhaR [Chromatiales bacterium]
MNYKHLHYFWRVAKLGGIARASEELHLTPQTISGQIKLLEDDLGAPLFAKRGRTLELTDAGRVALGYAQDIFVLGAELHDSVRTHPGAGRPLEFRVGVADSVPRSIAYRLLEPATRMPKPVRIVCRGWKLDSLLSELAAHRLDLVISDAPIPRSMSVRAYNHRLGKSGVSFFAAASLVKNCKGKFPARLVGAPMLLPGEDSAVRPQLDRWCEANSLPLRIVAEFDDSALMKAFGRRGRGVFIGPTVLESEITAQYGVRVLGRTEEIVEEFFAISIERRITHPCVVAITQAARDGLFASGNPTESR